MREAVNLPQAAALVAFRLVHELGLGIKDRGLFVSMSGSGSSFAITTGLADVEECVWTITRSLIQGYKYELALTEETEKTRLVEEAFEKLLHLDASRLGNVQCFFAHLEQKLQDRARRKGLPLSLTDIVSTCLEMQTRENFVQSMIAHNWEKEAVQLFCAFNVENLSLGVYESLFRAILENGVREEFWREMFWQNLAERLGTVFDIKERPTDWRAVLREAPRAIAEAEQMLHLDSDNVKAAVQLQSIVLHLNWFASQHASPAVEALRALYSDPRKAKYLERQEPMVFGSWEGVVPNLALDDGQSGEDTSAQSREAQKEPGTPEAGGAREDSPAASVQSSTESGAPKEDLPGDHGPPQSVNANRVEGAQEQASKATPAIGEGEGLEPLPKRACPDDVSSGSETAAKESSTEGMAAAPENAGQANIVGGLEEEEEEEEEGGPSEAGSDQEPAVKRVRRKPAKKKGGQRRRASRKAKTPVVVVAAAAVVPKEKPHNLKRGLCVTFSTNFGVIREVDALGLYCDVYVYHDDAELVDLQRIDLKLLKKVKKVNVEDPSRLAFVERWEPKPLKPYDWVVQVQDKKRIYLILRDLGDHKFVAGNVSTKLFEEIDSMTFVPCTASVDGIKALQELELERMKVGSLVRQKKGDDLRVWKIESLNDWTADNEWKCIIRNEDMAESVFLTSLKFLDLSTPENALATLMEEPVETKRSFLRDWAKDIIGFVKLANEKIAGKKAKIGIIAKPVKDVESTVRDIMAEYFETGGKSNLAAAISLTKALGTTMQYLQAYLFFLDCEGNKEEFASNYVSIEAANWMWTRVSFGKAISEEPELGYVSGRFFKQYESMILLYFGLGFKLSDRWEPPVAPSPPPPPPEFGTYEMEADPHIEVEDFV